MESSRAHIVNLVVFLVAGLAVASLAGALRWGTVPTFSDMAAAGVIAVLVIACRWFPLHVGYKRKLLLDSAPLFAAALLLPVWLAGVVAFGSMAFAEAAGRGTGFGSLKQLAFNASQRALGVMAGGVVFHAVAHESLSQPGAETLAATPLAIGAMFVVQDVLLLGVITAQLGRGVVRDWLTDRGDIPYDLALYASGFVVAYAASFHLWLLAFMVFPIVVFHRAMRDRVTLRVQTRDAIEALADVVDARDPYTFEHSKRVAEHARAICDQLQLSPDLADEIVAAARVHDVGKVGVRDAVLLKPGALTEAEQGEVREHPDIGARLTARFPDFGRGTAYVRHHHERWDGTGYPAQLRGQSIPLGARVIAVADTYDAITSSRVYRAALSEEHARSEMERVSGTQLDPAVVRAFFELKGWVRTESPMPVLAGVQPGCARGVMRGLMAA